MRIFWTKWLNKVKEHQVLGLMLFLGLLFGLTFIFVVPPWQHYDEPTHFEYSWLIANQGGIPERGEYNQAMRREVAASMKEHEFFRDLGYNINLLSISKPIWIGISQAGSVPVYYWLSAIPLRLLRTVDITQQLYVARFVSLLLYLVTIVAAYGIAAELAPEQHPLRWLLPLTILLLPGFVDIMTAANDDVGAVAFFSLFLWSGIRLINKGFNWIQLLVFLMLAVICFFTKNTVVLAVALVLIPVGFSLFRGTKRKYFWIALVIGACLLSLSIFTWGDAANWYRKSYPLHSSRSYHPQAPLGTNVIRIALTPGADQADVEQLIPVSTIKQTKDLTITVGAWMWADHPTKVRTPILESGNELIYKEIEVDNEPEFFSVSGTIDPTNLLMKITLSPLITQVETLNNVYYDGIILVEGTRPDNIPPKFADANGRVGVWGESEFINLVRNPSGESAQPRIRPWVNRILGDYFPTNPSLLIGLLFNPSPIDFYYQATVKSLTQTFWAKFGWAQVILGGYRPYTALALITLGGFIGSLFFNWRNRKGIPWDIALFLGISLLGIWGLAVTRGLSNLVGDRYFLPVARYAYPVIIPTMLILNLGWLEIIRWIERYFRVPRRVMYAALILFFIGLNVISLVTIYRFFNA